MASQSNDLNFLPLCLVAILFLCPCSILGFNRNAPSFIQVCRKTPTPALCMASLCSDPRAAKADLRGLAIISLEISSSSAKENNASITSMLLNRDPIVSQALQSCITNYAVAVYFLDQQVTYLDNFNYKAAANLIGFAPAHAEACERNFVRGPGHFSPLTDKNMKFEKLCGISDAIIALLPGAVG